MNQPKGQRKPSNPVAAGISGAIFGGACGALIGASFSGASGAWFGALMGGLYFGFVEAVTDLSRKPGELKPLWHRLIGTVMVGGALGVILGAVFGSALVVGLLMGLLVGLTGLAPRKIALGITVGLVAGILALIINPELNAAIVGGTVMLSYRLLLLLFFKDSAPVQFSAEHVAPADAKYVVPFEAHTKYVGAAYMETLARESDGSFKRNVPGIGIVETMDALRGPSFDPELIDPLIQEFYEHTSRFELSIEPVWNPIMKPFFWFFKTFLAQKIGQANLPFNTKEAQRGMVSYIDTIAYDSIYDSKESADDYIKTLRGWIRAYEDSGEAIYVGIYTVVRHQNVGFVSVGFPLPEANFTATLLPFNSNNGNLILKTQDTGSPFPGHYLTDIDDEDGSLTILELSAMDEAIEVYVQDGQLRTDHHFYLGGFKFLTLNYSMERKAEAETAENLSS